MTTTAGLAPTEASANFGHLRKHDLSFPEVISQSIATVAPSGTPGLVIGVVFATAGNGTWLAYLFATIALLIVSLQINVFASRVATPGSLYLYAAHGLGPLAGVVAGWSLLIGYVFTAAAVVVGTVSTGLAFARVFGLDATSIAAFVLLATAALAVAWWFAYRDIKISTRVTLAIEGGTIALILAVVIGFFLVKGGVQDQAQLSLEGVNFDQLRLGLILAFFSFVGFESATVLGVEAKSPRRLIPRAVTGSVLAVGLLFIVSAYALVAAFHGAATTLDKADAPLTVLAQASGAGWLGVFISLGVALSFFACILGSINAAARVLYTFSRHGIFHGSAESTHEAHSSPHVAASIVSVVVLGLSAALLLSGYGLLDAYFIFGSIATYGFLLAYGLVTIAAPVFLKRRGELKLFNIVSAVLALILVGVALLGTIYPVPPYPYNILPYVFLALLAAGVGYFLFLNAYAPRQLKSIETDLLGSLG